MSQHQWMPPVPPPGPWQTAPEGPAPAPAPSVEQPQPLYRRLIGPLIVVAALLLKFGKFALVALKGAKFATTALSMVVSIGAYTLIWGWKFAIGFVALLYVHEMGHYIQLRREGIKPGRMIFIPLFGAVISAKSMGGNALAEARIGLAGPILGSLATAALVPVALITDNDLWRALAYVGFFLNLINLLPVVPLDGGRAFAALAPWMWFVGLAVIITLVFLIPNPFIIIIALFTSFETYRRWKNRKAGEEGNADYYKVKPAHRLAVLVVYLGLVVVLGYGMLEMFVPRDFGDV